MPPRRKKGKIDINGVESNHRKAWKWISNFEHVTNHISKYNIRQRLDDDPKQLICIENFLPAHVADFALNVVESIDERQWHATVADADYAQNNIDHKFKSTKTSSVYLDGILRVFSVLTYDDGRYFDTFSAAKYSGGDHIAPHDDKAYTNVRVEGKEGKVIECSRDITLVYYLTTGWEESDGGAFVDLVHGRKIIPNFNTAIFFKVPFMHQVEKVVAKNKPRYSIFGWYLLPGRLYALDTEKDEEPLGGGNGNDSIDESIDPRRCKLAQRILQNYAA